MNESVVEGETIGDLGGSPPVQLAFVGCGQHICLPKNGLQESGKGCGYYLNCWYVIKYGSLIRYVRVEIYTQYICSI